MYSELLRESYSQHERKVSFMRTKKSENKVCRNLKEKIRQCAKKKKGFTLVELVIVIAILAILAAIAIPVITTTINSSKMSVMESDAATLNMLVKEAVNISKVELRGITYNSKSAALATVADICKENDIGQGGNYTVDDGTFFSRNIGGVSYTMVFTKNIGIEISGGTKTPTTIVSIVRGNTSIRDLDPT